MLSGGAAVLGVGVDSAVLGAALAGVVAVAARLYPRMVT
jgi:hypothetical protein